MELFSVSMSIMRRVHFCAGHRLHGHEGKCAHFHGHNYVAEFHVTGSGQDHVGRVIDFSMLKAVLKGWIDEHWDHGFLLSEQDENGVTAIRLVEHSRYYIMPGNPTAENMAAHLLHEICPRLLKPLNVTAWKVVIWESEDSCATATHKEALFEGAVCGSDSEGMSREHSAWHEHKSPH
jgi:6-pyruvoyltetrahydropterin/6-carboxytetrahydropterin synthase